MNTHHALQFGTFITPHNRNPEATVALARLRQLKQRYDPHNVFRDNFNIAPEREKESA